MFNKTPTTEGERYTSAENLMEHKRDRMMNRLTTDPASMTLVGDFLTQLDLMWGWTQRVASRDGATYSEQIEARAAGERRMMAWDAIQAMFRTPEGKALRDAIATKYAGEVKLW
jgi:hypothetical protein